MGRRASRHALHGNTGPRTVTLYPIGYQSQLVTMAGLRRVHEPDMHPEMARRLWPWLESEQGRIGIGGGERPNPDPVSPASSQGRSFHPLQQFRSKLVRYCAVDLVHISNGVHRSPTWAEVASAPWYGLHAFIGHDTNSATDDEPWHLQPVELRGYQQWLNAGRPDPAPFTLPNTGVFVHATIRKGDVNADVYGAQSVLRFKASQPISVDGVFDTDTDTAMRNLQRIAGLTVDGICGPKTWVELDKLANS